MKKICVFCGSSNNVVTSYMKNGKMLGRALAQNNLGLVYGGASVGIMGAVANGCLEENGKVWGVIPKSILDLEVGHVGLTELEIVENMHERKQKMYDLSDAFFALPGGWGTLDELCEIVTWAQLHYHHKPCYLINEDGFFDHLIKHLERCTSAGFMKKEDFKLIRIFKTADEALEDYLKKY